MKVTQEYNVGIDVKKYKLKPDDVKIFKILTTKRDKHYPDRPMIPAAVIVPSKDIIIYNGEPVEIACIKTTKAKGVPVLHELWFLKESAGTITCRGGNVADQQKYEYLMLCNFRKNNPDRDPTKRALFELLDPKAKATEERATRTERLRAMKYAEDMERDEVMTFSAASGWDVDDEDVLRNRIESMAESDPLGFLARATNRHNNIKADIKRALDKQVISFDAQASSFSWSSNGELITNVPRSTKGSHLDGLLNFIINNERGESVYDEIKLLLGKSKPKK